MRKTILALFAVSVLAVGCGGDSAAPPPPPPVPTDVPAAPTPIPTLPPVVACRQVPGPGGAGNTYRGDCAVSATCRARGGDVFTGTSCKTK